MICISMMMIFLTTISNVSGQGGVPTWMRPPGEQSKMFGSTLGNPLGGKGSAILSTKGSDVMSPVPLPSTLFGLHATDQTTAESPFAGPTQYAFGAPHEMRMKDPYPAPHQPTAWGLTSNSANNPMYSPPASELGTAPPANPVISDVNEYSMPSMFLELQRRNYRNRNTREIPEFMHRPENPNLMGQEHVSIISPATPVRPTSNIPAYPLNGGAPVHPTAYSYSPPSAATNAFIELRNAIFKLNQHTYKMMKEIPEFMHRPENPNLMGQEHVSIISPATPVRPTSNIPAYPLNGGAPVHPTAYSYSAPSAPGAVASGGARR